MGGAIGCPYIYGVRHLFPKEQRKRSLVLNKKNSSEESSLSLNNMPKVEELINGKVQELSFAELGMKFGETTLSPRDILTSPCQDNKYYLMKYVNGWNYKLGESMIARTPRCQETDKYAHLKHITLDWKNPTRSSITVGSCWLIKQVDSQKKETGKLSIVCNVEQEHWRRVVGTFGEESFEYQ